MTLEELKVIISAETSGLKKELNSLQAQLSKTQKNVDKSTNKISNSFKKLTAAVSLTAITVGLVKVSKSAIRAASDLEEVQNVVDVAFGSMAAEVDAFAKTAIMNFGLGELQAKQFASTFMAMSNGMGIAAKDGKNMSLQLTALTGDMASFFNVSQDVAATALNSIFTGETETLKKFGVVMTEANLNAYALSQGIKKSYNEMSQAEKVLLRYNYVLKITQQSQGDFARTSNSWANQTRILSVQWNQFLSIIGKGLTQILTPLIKALNQMLSVLISIGNSITKIIGGKTTNKMETNVKNTADSAADLNTGLEDANNQAKELSRTIAGFDEINILGEQKNTSTNNGSSDNFNVADFKIDESAIDGQIQEAQTKIEKFMAETQAKFDAWKLSLPKLNLNFNSEQALADLKAIGANILSTIGGLGDFVIRIGIEIANDLDIGKLSNSFLSLTNAATGLASTVVSVLSPALITFYQEGLSPLTKAVGDVLDAILQWTAGQLKGWTEWFETNKTDIKIFAQNLGAIVEPLSTIVGELLKVAWGVISEALNLASATLKKIAEMILKIPPEVIAAIVGSLLTLAGIKGFEFVAKGIKSISESAILAKRDTSSLTEGISYFFGTFNDMPNKVGSIFVGIGEKFDAFTVGVASKTEPLRNALGSIVGAMQTEFAKTITYSQSTGEALALVGRNAEGMVGKSNYLLGAVRGLGAGFSQLWQIILANPVGAIIALIAALGAAFYTLYTTNEKFRKNVQALWNDVIKPILQEVVDNIKTLWFDHLKPLFDRLSEAGGHLKEGLSSLWETLAPILEDILKVVMTALTVIIGQIGVILKVATKVIGGIIDAISGIIDFLTGVFTGDWEKAWNGIVLIFKGIKDSIDAVVNGIIESIRTAIKNIKESISALWGNKSKGGIDVSVNANAPKRAPQRSMALDVPQLAKGGVIKAPTVAMMGEYAGASRNPEIVAPQSILQQVMASSNSELMNAIYSIGNQISKSVEEKDTDIYMDTAKITRRITKEQNAQKKQMGSSLVLI